MPRKLSFRRSSSDEVLVGRVPLAPRALVQPLGERLGEPVGERLDGDRRVVVVRGLVARRELVGAVDRDGERADVVVGRRDVVGEAAVRPAVAVVGLLAQEAEARAVDDDVVARRRARARSRRRPRAQRRALQDLAQERLRVVVELARRRVARGSPGTCPSGPTRGRRTASRCTGRARRAAARPRACRRTAAPAGRRSATPHAVRARRGERQQRLARSSPRAGRAAAPGARGSPRRASRGASGRAAPRRRRRRGSRRARARSRCAYSGAIFTAVCCRDVVAPPISSGSSSRAALHLARDVDHLVERRRDQPREADDVDALALGGVEDLARPAPSRRGRSPRSRCSRARRRRCSCRCRARRP